MEDAGAGGDGAGEGGGVEEVGGEEGEAAGGGGVEVEEVGGVGAGEDVAVLPATCLGPLLQPDLNASSAVLRELMMGSRETQEYHWLGAVHVKDVAKAHVLLYETPTAAGRYLCTNGIYQFSSFAAMVSELYPEFPIHRFDFFPLNLS